MMGPLSPVVIRRPARRLSVVTVLALAGCTVPWCDADAVLCDNQGRCVCDGPTGSIASALRDRDGGVLAPAPAPVEPDPVEPDPVEPPREVCDGGARDCRDGEEPTGTVDDPLGYLDRASAA